VSKTISDEAMAEVVAILKCLVEDFTMLAAGDWVPDDDGCTASIDATERALTLLAEADA